MCSLFQRIPGWSDGDIKHCSNSSGNHEHATWRSSQLILKFWNYFVLVCVFSLWSCLHTCDELVPCPGGTLPSPVVSWYRLQHPLQPHSGTKRLKINDVLLVYILNLWIRSSALGVRAIGLHFGESAFYCAQYCTKIKPFQSLMLPEKFSVQQASVSSVRKPLSIFTSLCEYP